MGSVDDLIEANDKIIQNLELFAKEQYRVFVITRKETMTPLESLVESITTGLNPRKNFKLGSGDNYYVTIKNMDGSNVILDNKCDKIDDDALSKISARSHLAPGDILFSGIGTIGRPYICYDRPNNWNVSESVFVLKPKKTVSSEFLYETVSSDEFISFANSSASGAAQKGIRMSDLKAHLVPAADSETIHKFDEAVTPILKEAHRLREEIRLLEAAKRQLLEKYFGFN